MFLSLVLSLAPLLLLLPLVLSSALLLLPWVVSLTGEEGRCRQ